LEVFFSSSCEGFSSSVFFFFGAMGIHVMILSVLLLLGLPLLR
jgi:hypothetical protein